MGLCHRPSPSFSLSAECRHWWAGRVSPSSRLLALGGMGQRQIQGHFPCSTVALATRSLLLYGAISSRSDVKALIQIDMVRHKVAPRVGSPEGPATPACPASRSDPAEEHPLSFVSDRDLRHETSSSSKTHSVSVWSSQTFKRAI